MRLQGKTAVVTGGSRGIGAAVGQALAQEGAAVILAARSVDQVEELAAGLRAAGHQAWGAPCDVTSPDSIAALAESANRLAGQVDILVNNAGIASASPLKRQELAEWERMFAVNVTGTFLCSKAFLPAMVDRGWGRVVNVASVAGLMGAPYISAYAASKHAVIGFTRAVAAEVATSGVTVNAVCPGYVDTPMLDATIENIQAKTGMDRTAALGTMEAMSPQGRVFTVEEVAYQVVHVCDPRARGMTGQALVLDGGAQIH